MAKPKMRLESNFLVAKKSGHKAIEELIRDATAEMHDKAQLRLQNAAARRDYNLDPGDIQKESSDKEGRIWFAQWWGRFFEYGTVYIAPLPFMRPGHRAGRKYLKTQAPDVFEKWMRKARV